MSFRLLAVTSYYKPAYTYGGPVRSVSALFEAMVQKGVHVEVCTTNVNGTQRLDVPVGELVDVNGVGVRYYNVYSGMYNYYSPPLGDAVRQRAKSFDLIHIEGVWNYNFIVGSDACRRKHKPYIVTPRGALLPWSLRQKRFKKKTYFEIFVRKRLNSASRVYCTDEIEAKEVKDLGICAPVAVIPNGIDLRGFQTLPPRSKMRSQLNIPDDEIVLLFVGRLHKKKRPDIVIEVLAALCQKLQRQVHAILVGPDEEKIQEYLEQLAVHYGAGDRVHFVGLLEHDAVLAAYASADLLLMPSEPSSENFGMVAVEAMAAGIPVVTTKGIPAGTWAQIFQAGRVSDFNVSEFIRIVIEILQDDQNLHKMRENGKNLVKSKFCNLAIAHQVIDVYSSIIKHE